MMELVLPRDPHDPKKFPFAIGEVQRLVAWSVRPLNLPEDLLAYIEYVPDGYLVETITTPMGDVIGTGHKWGETDSDREMMIRIPGGRTMFPPERAQTWIEILIELPYHEGVHVLQFAAQNEIVKAAAESPEARIRVPSAPAPELPPDFTAEEWADFERRADRQVSAVKAAIDEAEARFEEQATLAGIARLEEWRDLTGDQRDAIRFGKLSLAQRRGALWS